MLEQFWNRLVPESNETFELYKFLKRNQEPEEMINAYVTAAMKLADSCNFGALKDSHIRDRLVHGIRDDFVRFKLLVKKQLGLAKCLEILRSSQITFRRAQELSVDEAHFYTQSGVDHHPRIEGHLQRKPKQKRAANSSLMHTKEDTWGRQLTQRNCAVTVG